MNTKDFVLTLLVTKFDKYRKNKFIAYIYILYDQKSYMSAKIETVKHLHADCC